jgi:hypothetical protein
MVIALDAVIAGSGFVGQCLAGFLAAEAPRPLIERLDPPRRAAVMAALAGLIFLAFVCTAGIWLWGQWLRRRLRKDRPQPRAPLVSDWDRKQPVEEDSPPSPGGPV